MRQVQYQLRAIKECQRWKQICVSFKRKFSINKYRHEFRLMMFSYKTMMAKLNIFCPTNTGSIDNTIGSKFLVGEGCGQRVPWRNLQNHLSECEYVVTKCQFCTQLVTRKQLAQHKESCPFRIVKCEACKEDHRFNQSEVIYYLFALSFFLMLFFKEHSEVCTYKIVECTKGCGAEVVRKELPLHFEECLEAEIQCEFLNCEIKVHWYSIHLLCIDI